MKFPHELLLPQKTIFRPGAAKELCSEGALFGHTGLIVHGMSLKKSGNLEAILSACPEGVGIETYLHQGGEPTLDDVSTVIHHAKKCAAQWIAGIGGGSIIDLAKAAAGLVHAGNPPQYYQEGGKVEKGGTPFIAVPTTAGTGSEVTINSVILNNDKTCKLSIRDKRFLAQTVILDAGLLADLPDRVLAYAGMDAYVQAYESFTSQNATWWSDTIALKALELIDRHLLPAYTQRKEIDLAQLLLGSYLAGIALASARLGVIHGIAHPLGALYNLPHGLICTMCFIPSLTLNRESIGGKYDEMSDLVGDDFIRHIEKVLDMLHIVSPFKEKEIKEQETIIMCTLASGSTAANPKKIVREDVEFLLKELF